MYSVISMMEMPWEPQCSYSIVSLSHWRNRLEQSCARRIGNGAGGRQKHRWGAWYLHQLRRGLRGRVFRRRIVLETGPDDATRAGYAEPGPVSNVYLEGETVLCPKCWIAVEVTRRAAPAPGRTCQVLQAEVVNVDAYTAVLYWLVSRHFDDTGGDHILFLPHAALPIDGDGRLRRFSRQADRK